MYPYPHTIDNGHGERITFRRRVRTPQGERVEGDNVVEPGAGPLMHVHYLQEEGFTVVQGRMGYQIEGSVARYAGAGESAVFPPGVPHRFWNAGNDELIVNAWFTPPGNAEFFLTNMFDAQKRGSNGRPDVFDAAWLARRYRNEYAMTTIPRIVQRTIFPLIVMVGTLLGKYRKFANAPLPLKDD
jgi:quercetin dioxygenase-like cupin family protein